jgi:pSer/pThr/pTyr-binding forkhead associated (FHA) protein
MSARSTAAKVAKWLVSRDRRDEAVSLLCAYAASAEGGVGGGANDAEGQDLLAEAFRLDPGSQLAQLAFERMEGLAAKDHGPLLEAIARWTPEEVQKLEKQIARPNFMRAQVGFNNNIKFNGIVFHIQTEDSGLDRPHIITHLFADGGRIIKSHKRSYANEVQRPDIAPFVRALMKGQHMEMAIMLREGRFDEVVAGRAMGGIEVLETPPRLEVQKLATKKEERVEAAPASRSQPPPAIAGAAAAAPAHVPVQAGADDETDDDAPTIAPPPPPPPSSQRIQHPPPSQPATGPSIAKLVGKPVERDLPSRFRLHVLRSIGGGPAFYEPRGDAAIIGADGAVALFNERFCHPREAQIRWVKSRMWLVDLEAGNGVFLRVRQPVELEVGDEFMVGDQVLSIERNPEPNDGPGPGPTYFYSSPKWQSAFRVVQVFEGGAKGACVVARGTTMQIGSAIGDFVFTGDPLVDDQHCLVEEQAGSIVLSDLGSRTGVFVRIKGEQELVNGDEIIVGRTRLQLEALA